MICCGKMDNRKGSKKKKKNWKQRDITNKINENVLSDKLIILEKHNIKKYEIASYCVFIFIAKHLVKKIYYVYF